MKRTILTISLITGLLMGCEQREIQQELEPVAEETPIQETLELLESDFRFVAGWTDDSTIAFVEHRQGKDRLQTYNIQTQEIHTVFEHQHTISEVLIHPSTQQLLVKTADNPTEAELLLMDEKGIVSDTLTVESTELEIQWNKKASSKLLVSAFQEDWSAQVLLFDTENDTVTNVNLTNPFPQWINEKEIIYSDDTDALWKGTPGMDGTELLVENVRRYEASDGMVVAEVMDEDEINYQLIDDSGELQAAWNSTEFTGIMEDMEVRDDNIIMSTSGDETTEQQETNIYLMNANEVKKHTVEAEGAAISCSPDSSLCLVGYSLDTLVDMDTGEADKWLELVEAADDGE